MAKAKNDKQLESILYEINKFTSESSQYLARLAKVNTYKRPDGSEHSYGEPVSKERGILKARSLLLIRALSAWRRGGYNG